MAPRYPSKKKAREKRPKKGRDKQATLKKIIKKPGKERKKFHRFLQQTGEEFMEKLGYLDDFYSAENFGLTWEFDGNYLPRPILSED